MVSLLTFSSKIFKKNTTENSNFTERDVGFLCWDLAEKTRKRFVLSWEIIFFFQTIFKNKRFAWQTHDHKYSYNTQPLNLPNDIYIPKKYLSFTIDIPAKIARRHHIADSSKQLKTQLAESRVH